MRHLRALLGFAIAGVVLAGTLTACDLFEGEWLVNRAADGADAAPGDGVCEVTPGAGDCSFRAATDEANLEPGSDRVTIQPGLDPEPFDFAPIVFNMVLEGNGATFHQTIEHFAGTLVISDVTITGVVYDEICGAAINSQGGPVTLQRVTITDNVNEPAPFEFGSGAVCASGGITIIDSVIADNIVGPNAGGPTAAVVAGEHLIVMGSTISGNHVAATTAATGAALAMRDSGRVVIGQSTIADNATATPGGATIHAPTSPGLILQSTVTDGGTGPLLDVGSGLEVRSSILASSGAVCGSEQPSSGGYNLTSDATCAFGSAGDVTGDAQLGPVADNGGATPTRLPAATSPAVDAIPLGTPQLCDGTLVVDQRGSVRPSGPACDIGAVERS